MWSRDVPCMGFGMRAMAWAQTRLGHSYAGYAGQHVQFVCTVNVMQVGQVDLLGLSQVLLITRHHTGIICPFADGSGCGPLILQLGV